MTQENKRRAQLRKSVDAWRDFARDLEKKRDEAMKIALEYGTIDGSHHKQWVIDQMVRALMGDQYPQFVLKHDAGGEYEWKQGIAP